MPISAAQSVLKKGCVTVQDESYICTKLELQDSCQTNVLYSECDMQDKYNFQFSKTKIMSDDHLIRDNEEIKQNKEIDGGDQVIAQDEADEPHEKEINILLLGETGVGKSTWINGIANYLTFPTLDEAVKRDILSLIPISFTTRDDKYQEIRVIIGSDDNENPQGDQSCTQLPKTYCFKYGRILVRLIDTPGMGDTRGADKDLDNFKNILSHIAPFDELHGICILLKPNNARLNVMFTYCIQELLTNLHKSACRNIVFCFTNARSTFYRPGDTLPALETLLRNNKVNIDTSKNTIYCTDNEAIRYLASVKSGIEFTESEQNCFSESWKKSVEESVRLITNVASLEPHFVRDTLSINDARRMILCLDEPLAKVTVRLQDYIDDIRSSHEELPVNCVSDKKTSLLSFLTDCQIVCTSKCCIEEIDDADGIKYLYKCSKPPKFKFAISLSKKKCKQCGCDKKFHEKRECEIIDKKTKMFSSAKPGVSSHSNDGSKKFETQSTSKQHASSKDDNTTIKRLSSVRQQLSENKKPIISLHEQSEKDQLKDEHKQLLESIAKFASFLKRYAITPYNDAMDDYLKVCIKTHEEKTDIKLRFQNMQDRYSTYVQRCDSVNESCNTNPKTPQDIKQLIDDLFALKNVGSAIRTVAASAELEEIKAAQKREVFVNLETISSPEQTSIINTIFGKTFKFLY